MPEKYFTKKTGLIKTQGKDVIDFIGRMSTNDFKKFNPSEFRKTVLTTDKGRIVDLINVFNDDGSPVFTTSHNFQDKVISHLDKYIIMDDVQLNKDNEEYTQIIIFCNGYPMKLAKSIFEVEPGNNKFAKINEGDFIYTDDFKVNSLNIICDSDKIQLYKDKLNGLEELSCSDYERMRIDAGIPEAENELNDQINPVECGLSRYISFTKGCYIGQEVIARLDSQGKIPKQMIRVKGEDSFRKGDKIFDNDMKETGFISTALQSNGGSTGLGFIRTTSLDFEKNYFTQINDNKNLITISKIN